MAFLRPDFDPHFLLGGAETTLQGSATETAIANSPDDCFDLFGCPDISKGTESNFEQSTAKEAEAAHCEANADTSQAMNMLYGFLDFGESNPLLEEEEEVAVAEATSKVDEVSAIAQEFQDLEDFLASECQHQLAEAQISQPQPAAAPVPAKTTKCLAIQQKSSAPTVAKSLLLSSTSSSSSSLQSQNSNQPILRSFATPASSTMTLQLDALDLPGTTTKKQPVEDEMYDLKTGLPVDSKYLTSFPESELSYDSTVQDTFDSYNGEFAVEFQLSDYSSTDLDLIIENSQKAELSYETSQSPHVRFEDSELLKNDNLALSHFGVGKLYLPSSELLQLNNDLEYESLAQAARGRFDTEEEFLNRPLSSFKDGYFGLTTSPETTPANGVSPLFLSTVPRTMMKQKGFPISAEGLVQLGLEIRKSIANLSKKEYSKFAAKHDAFVAPRTGGTSANRDKKPDTTIADDQLRVSKAERAKKPRKDKRQFSYDNVFVKANLVYTPNLKNVAKNPLNLNYEYENKLVVLLGQGDSGINRKRYQRNNIDVIRGLHRDVHYEKNPFFDVNHPYQQEFTRVELYPNTNTPIMETRSALCAYCDDIHFYELKNSCYSQHMSHSHGIYTDDYLTPDPLLFGRYQVSKKATAGRKTRPRIRCHEGVVCPACFEVVEVRCWSSTLEKKPLSNYLRHFKEAHRVDKRKETFFNLHA